MVPTTSEISPAAASGRPYIWGDFSTQYRREHRHCHRCGAPTNHTHHPLPPQHGGPLVGDDNAEALCSACHTTAHRGQVHLPVEGWKPRGKGPSLLGRDLETRLNRIGHITGAPPLARRKVFESCREVIRALLPPDERNGRNLAPQMLQTIVREAVRRLREIDQMPDADDVEEYEGRLPELFALALANLFGTADPAKGSDALWYDDTDLTASFNLIAPQLSNARVALYTTAPPTQVRYACAVAHRVITKQSLKRDGAASTLAVKCELALHGLPTGGTFAKAIFAILADLPLIHCTDPRYWHGHCRRWAITGATSTLPFVRRYQAAQEQHQEARQLAQITLDNEQMRALLHSAAWTWSPENEDDTQEYKEDLPISHSHIASSLGTNWLQQIHQALETVTLSRF